MPAKIKVSVGLIATAVTIVASAHPQEHQVTIPVVLEITYELAISVERISRRQIRRAGAQHSLGQLAK